ncbi:hypothetical protein [Luteibacter sp. SG786]|uniref:hypothetical protein n=1 Tax=Luteibacter sp. SG786 TaxID=2587130 RepID=UPI0014218F40|nr:hypothetical protein [Luteibacter sp. SG786]NII54939.1 hypothetical protein [Luteibacter sp. SG786]
MTTSRDDFPASATPTELTERLRIPEAALAPLPAGMPADNLLLASVQDDTLVLLLARAPLQVKARDTVQLLDDGRPMGADILVDPFLGDTDIPLPVSPTDRTDERIYRINYRVTYGSGDPGNTVTGPDDQQFIVDYTAPGGDEIAHPEFAADVVADGVTPDRLSTDPDGNEYLPATVAPYFFMRDGDRIDAFIDGQPVPVGADVGYLESGMAKELRFPRALLESLGVSTEPDGKHGFAIGLVDRAGNRSSLSHEQRLLLRLKETIDDLLPPRVPGATDGLVTESDARASLAGTTGALVEIPGHDAIKEGDTVVWWWNTTEFPPVSVDASGVGADPLMTLVAPYERVYDDWFLVAGDTDRNVAAEAGYRVERQGRPLGEPDPARPQVNLFGPGGRDPNPSTPEHERLQPPSVQPAGGGPVNVIPGDAIDEDATAIIPGVTADNPPIPAFRPGDSVQFFWDGIPVDAPFVVTTAGRDVTRTVPAATLTAHSPGTWNVHYVATRKLALAPFENAARSSAQAVDVMDVADIPGGGAPLREAKWLEGPAGSGVPDQIDYEKAVSDGGTPLRIYGYENIGAGDTLRMVFQGYRTTTPGTDPIPESRYEFEYEVLPQDLTPKQDDSVSPPVPAVFIDRNIPTEYLLYIEYGTATFNYTATNASGSAAAKQAWIYVATRH